MLNLKYIDNIRHLNAIVGSTIESALEEQFFSDDELDDESLGTLKLKFSNNLEFIFNCDGDAESLSIKSGGFLDKGTLNDMGFKWKVREYFSQRELSKLGEIKNCQIELLSNQYGTIQSGCRIIFENENYLNIWTTTSDNIFYGINLTPPYYNKKEIKVELKDIKTLHDKL